MNDDDVVRALAALAQPSRLQIFRSLVVAGSQGMTPTALSDALLLPGTSLSFHLKELSRARLITQERQGRYLIYRALYSTMNEVLAYLTLNCCDGQPCELRELNFVETGASPCRPIP